MARTDHFKKLHVEILLIAKNIRTLPTGSDAEQHTTEVRRLLSRLS